MMKVESTQRMAQPQSHSVEDYLEAIFELGEEGVRVLQARLAKRLGVTRAAVSEQVARLIRMKLLTTRAGKELELTAHGYAVAEDAVRKHRMAERFLTDVLKMPWHKAHEEAVNLQTGMTQGIEEAMMRLLEGPATCPHGNPIPGTGATIAKDLRSLNQFKAGATVVLVRLTEDVELDGAAMRYFEDRGLMPGARIDVVAVSPDGTMSLRVGKRRSSLGPALADNLWMRPIVDQTAAANRKRPRQRRQ